jgi:TonB family protein
MIRVQVLSLALVAAMTVAATSSGQTEQTSSDGQDVVSASTLKRTSTITPTWPESAARVEGWVLLRFTVLPNGTVTDVEVKESNPAGVFEASAVEALRQWKFEPVERDGKKIAQRAEIRVNYALSK